MATAFQAYVHCSFKAPVESHQRIQEVSGISGTREDVSNASHHAVPSRPGPWTGSGATNTTLTELARSFKLHNSNGMAISKIISADYKKLLEWIRSERMRTLPPEGSSYNKVLVCAKLFVEWLHSFDGAIQHFAQESNMAAQLAYIYCASILKFGEENSDVLLNLFSFFYQCSFALENLLGRAELFTSLSKLQNKSVTIDLNSTFTGPIKSFRTRCEDLSESMWRHQLSREGLIEGKVTEIKMMKWWLEPEDPVLTGVTRFTAQFAQEQEELTCLWVTPHITRFLKSDQKSLVITGEPGSGKSILATVINEQLQRSISSVSYLALFVPINSRIPGLATPLAVANSLLSQLFATQIRNISLYCTLSDTYQHCQQTVDEDQYVDLLWDALKSALPASLKGAKQTVIIVDGADEASCGQTALLHCLNSATANADNLKLIVLGSEKPEHILGQLLVQITPELIFDDIAAVVWRVFKSSVAFNTLAIEEQETCVNRIVKGANASFLWAKLASEKVREEGQSSAQGLTRAVGDLLEADHSINDFVSHVLRSNVHQDGAKIIAWSATAARPLATWELSAILSIQLEKGVITWQETDPLVLLKPLAAFVHQYHNVYLRHGRICSAIVEALARDRLIAAIKDTKLDFVRRISLYIKQAVTGRDEPSMDSPDMQLTSRLLECFTRMTFGCNTDQEIVTAGKELSQVFPTSTLVPLLETTPATVWKDKSTPMRKLLHDTQTRLYQQVLGSKHPATLQAVVCRALFYKTIQNQALSTQHIIIMWLTKHFLDFTTNQVSTSRTDIMLKRVEMLRLLVECYKTKYGNTSDMVVSTLRQLVEHYKSINEVKKAEELTEELTALLKDNKAGRPEKGSRRPSEESLLIQLHGLKDVITPGTVLALDDVEEDELISSLFNFDLLLSAAEEYARENNMLAAERMYADIWQWVSKEYCLRQSIKWELRSLEFIKKELEVALILSSFWAEYGQKMSSTEEVVAKLVTVSEFMKSLKLSWLALDVLKQCAYFKEVMQDLGTSTVTELIDHEISATAANMLVQMYLTQHRWRDATKTLKRTSVNDVVLPEKDVAYCIELAQHLRDCYWYWRRAVKEEDLYECTCQREKLILVHLEILNDYTNCFGQGHPMVLQELRALVELTHPQTSSLDYYRRIFEILNKQSDICDSAVFEPLLVVVTELTNQECYSEALWPCKVLFNTLQHTQVNPRLYDAAFTHAEYHVIHDVTVQYRKGCLAVFATLEAIDEEQNNAEDLSPQDFHQVITARIQRLLTIRSTYGWAHESSLSYMEECSSSRLIVAAKSIVSSYRAIGQVQRAKKLALELYQQIVEKDTTNISSIRFDMTSSGRQSLLERDETLLIMNEIYSLLVAEYQYFQRFRADVHTKSSDLQSVLSTLQLEQNQAAIFLSTINFVRSIALASHNCVIQLLPTRDHHCLVCDLDGFSSLAMIKLLFKMGLAISNMLRVSALIIKEVLSYCKIKNIDLSQLSAVHINNLTKLLDQQKDYHNLAWILMAFWDKREKSRLTQTDDTYMLNLGCWLVTTHYLAGDYMSSICLAEDIAYNCAHVHGPRDPSMTEMTILLARIYTSVAYCYQGTEDHCELVSQYYKKAAALHENALRVFIDPSSASTTTDIDLEQPSPSISGLSILVETVRSIGKCIWQHLHLLKLVVERLGNWPKDYSEYKRLNSDLFWMFWDEL
ncbi:hypothetical protein BDV11DRAFT_210366 [Aspergillus similis]